MTRPDNTARNAEMARLYIGGSTLQAIGAKFGITRERVRQIIRPMGVLLEHGGARLRAAKRRADCSEQRTRRFLAKYDMTPERFATRRRYLRAYKQQERNAITRGIEWRLTFGQWIDVWEASGKLGQRGRHAEAFVMSRNGDTGAYEVGNVVIKTLAENSREAVAKWAGKKKAHKGVFLLMAGTARPFVAKFGNKRIGRFETAEAAAEARAQFIAQARSTPDAPALPPKEPTMRRSLAPHAHVPMPLRFTPAEIAGQQAERNATSWHRLAIVLAVACAVLLLIR